MKSAYEVLQVAESVSTEIVELVYKRLVFNHHPDRARDKTKADSLLKEINWAFGVISNPEKRALHDQELSASRTVAVAPSAALTVPKRRRKKKKDAEKQVEVQYVYVEVPTSRPQARYTSTVRIHHASDEDDDSGMSVSIHR